MTRIKCLILKNRMLVANLMINTLGLGINTLLLVKVHIPIPDPVYEAAWAIDFWFFPLVLCIGLGATLAYERPVRAYLDRLHQGESIPGPLMEKAKRRHLNEPFFLIAMDMVLWVTAAAVYTSCFKSINAPECVLDSAFFGAVNTGLMTVTVAFFAFEFIMQRLHAPYFFPQGGLYTTDRTLKIRIGTRLVALLFGCNLIPFLSIMQIFREMVNSGLEPAAALERLDAAIVSHCLVFMAVGAWLTFLVTSNLIRPIKEIITVLKSIQNGNFDTRVNVSSNDEIGYTGDVINQMTVGLKERDRIRHALNLAGEVQQRLLPKSDPQIPGLDIAGRSVYCDETGGDYYDYIPLDNGMDIPHRIGIVVGDVSDHGISSALLMATARALLRQRASLGGNPGVMVSDVNRQLTRDIGNSGQFMTVFLAIINTRDFRLSWVRAGHEPALMYDPGEDRFETLKGPGAALGLDESLAYHTCEAPELTQGQILILGTDGLWEVRNGDGIPFGKERILKIIRKHHQGSAAHISSELFSNLEKFLGTRQLEDDITLVIIKRTGS
ncbi:MAG: SpoIIE family protein phosphatase [Pseudomonadota bacterium]